MERPNLDENISAKDFMDFYWLKAELVAFCKKAGINASGGKIELSQRIESFLSCEKLPAVSSPKKAKPKSSFDWNTETLSSSTVVTDNYKNTENVRAFFTEEIGKNFSFNVGFMKWMKENAGKTLGDAVREWQRLNELKKNKSRQTEIAPQFEYNRYIRAFLEDNPNLKLEDARKFWKLKRSERGTNEYERKDFELE